MARFARARIALGLASAIVAAGTCGAAQVIATQAQDEPAATAAPGEGRYSFHRMGEGFVRLDSRTGELAQCGWTATGWACKVVPDERTALESEIGRLQRENAALKKSLLDHGIDLPSGIIAATPAQPGPVPQGKVPDASRSEPKAPSEADLDRAIAFMKHVWRRLVDLMTDLQRDIQKKS